MEKNDKMTTLEDFLQIPYPLVIKEKEKKYLMYIPKLNLMAEGDSLDQAFRLLTEQKNHFYQRLVQVDGIDNIPNLKDDRDRPFSRIDIPRVIVERLTSFVFTFLFWIIILSLIFVQVRKTGVKIKDAFDGSSPERSEARLARFKENLKIASPYIKEFQKILNE